ELIQALPAHPPLPNLGDKWTAPLKEIHNWKHWFSIHTNIVTLANNTANIFKNLKHLTDKRRPTHQNAVDGLLAAVTDLLTHALTIGKAVISFGLRPHCRSIVIHILNGFNKIDLVSNDQSSSNLPARFHELLNMFPDNKGVELLIVIGDDDQDDTDQSSIPHAKLKPDRLIITTTGKGRSFDTSEERRLQQSEADLLVYFNASYLFSSLNKDLFKSMLSRQRPTLLTFEDEEEFNEAKTCLSKKGVNIHQAGANQFSSLIIRQRPSRPNSVYSTNSYQILLNTSTINGSVERNDENYSSSSLSRQHPHQSSIGIQHSHTQVQHQQALNPGPKQVNGKIHIESLSSLSSSSSSSHNTQANNNGTPLVDTNVHIVSTTNTTNATTSVQPLIRPNNNNIRQPTVVQRRHHSPTATPSSSTVITNTKHKETRPRTTAMMTTIEPARHDIKPQPKPRLSLIKTPVRESEFVAPTVNGSLVQRIKPFFEQSPVVSSQEPKPVKQQRPPVAIPHSYQTGHSSKVTCLDDIIEPKKIYITSPPPVPPLPSTETFIDERTEETFCSPSSIEVHHREQRSVITTVANSTAQIPKSTVERHADERITKTSANSITSPSIIPIEIHQDSRPVMGTTTNNSLRLSSSLSTENRSDERLTTKNATNLASANTAVATHHLPTTCVQPAETHTEKASVLSENVSNSLSTTTNTTSSSSSSAPPPRPPLPTKLPSTNNEVIYTEVIKSHERSLPLHHIDLVKSPISPSRSFIIPSKSPSLLSKNSSYNCQRPSRSTTTTTTVPATASNFSYQINKSKLVQSTMAPDRISLYSQRSNKQPDVGVAIKNLSECIDRVGIVFDETNRPHDAQSTGLTTVDLIREQLTTSSTPQSTGSLLDKLYKSNSSTRLSSSSSRKPLSIANQRSKSQQAPRTQPEQPPIPKPAPSTPPSLRRPVGVFLPLTSKNTQGPEKTVPTTAGSEQASTLVYQNLEPSQQQHSVQVESKPTLSQTLDFTLKQPTAPVCNGIPKPFRKPTAIIEPSPVIPPAPSTTTPPSEPNYINLPYRDDQHIYTNENGLVFTVSSNSNSYTSKNSSICSTKDKQTVPSRPEPHYAVSNVAISSQPDPSGDYDSFDDDLVVDDNAKFEKPLNSNDNTDEDSFDDDENQLPPPVIPSKAPPANFFRSTLNRLTRSNKSLERLNTESATNDFVQETNPSNINDTKTKKTLRSIKARHEAKKTGNMFLSYTGDDDTTSIDSNCSTQTATSLNKTSNKSSHHRFRLFRRKLEKDFASDTEAEKHQTEERRKKWNKKILNDAAQELKNKRLLMMSDDDDDVSHHLNLKSNEDAHIYDHIVHDETPAAAETASTDHNHSSRMGKLSNETHMKAPTITLDEIRSELQAEIAARQDIQMPNQSLTSSNLTLQKKRSKSVTFLDELLSDDSKEKLTNPPRQNEIQIKSSTTAKRIEKGDARSICGALTGTGPIRGIIKAANNDITGTTAPVSPSAAAAAIYLSGTTIEARCTSPKVTEHTHRPLSTYTVGSARFYDGAVTSSNTGPPPPIPPPPPPSTYSHNQTTNSSNYRPTLSNMSQHSTSDANQHQQQQPHHYKRPTAKVSPFQTKSPNDPSSSSPPISTTKQTIPTTKKPVRSSINRNVQMSYDITNVATPSVSEGVGGVSKRLQSNF
ncbi:unnamed protein product, partial [Adineta ricciae]